MLKTLFMCFSLLVGTPQPAENYHSWISPEISDIIIDYVIKGEYHEHVDFNGDGELTIADAVGVRKRYEDNCQYGNEITVDSKAVETIVKENYLVDAMYWEFDIINGEIEREFEITASEITTARIYIELSDYSTEFVEIEINPFTECVRVTS